MTETDVKRLSHKPASTRGADLASFSAHPKLGDEVTRALREAVVTGVFRPGERLTVDDLASQFGVSTMPVREALVALAAEGILDGVPRRGFRVAQISRHDIEDVFRVHGYVAGLLAAAAATEITEGEVATLRLMQQQIIVVALNENPTPGSGAAQRVAELNFQFHRTINRIPDAERLRWFLRAATRYISRRFYEQVPGWLEATIDEHPGLLDALERHDSEAAQALTIEHVSRAGSLVVVHLDEIGYWSD